MGDYVNAVPNYTGPYISNGKVQESVAFGNRVPKNRLDALARLHDTAYAMYSDDLHRTMADLIFCDYIKTYFKKDKSAVEAAAQYLVGYGNYAARIGENMAAYIGAAALGAAASGPVGFGAFVATSVKNDKLLWEVLHKGPKIRSELIKTYRYEDPYPEYQYEPDFNLNPIIERAEKVREAKGIPPPEGVPDYNKQYTKVGESTEPDNTGVPPGEENVYADVANGIDWQDEITYYDPEAHVSDKTKFMRAKFENETGSGVYNPTEGAIDDVSDALKAYAISQNHNIYDSFALKPAHDEVSWSFPKQGKTYHDGEFHTGNYWINQLFQGPKKYVVRKKKKKNRVYVGSGRGGVNKKN